MVAAHPALRAASPDELHRIAERVRPVALADQQLLPVLDALTPLVPWGGLARGTTLACTGIGATSLTLSLAAGASGHGAWTVAVGLSDLGLAAAAELGIDLRRFCLVGPPPPDQWVSVIGALVGAFDLVVVRPTHRVRPGDARRLVARARERGTVLLVVAPGPACAGWPDAPDLQLAITRVAWEGLGQGHGHLEARRVRVETTGRGRASRPCTADLWLLDPDGRVAPVEQEAAVVRGSFAGGAAERSGAARGVPSAPCNGSSDGERQRARSEEVVTAGGAAERSGAARGVPSAPCNGSSDGERQRARSEEV